ncbi:hypothetical protein TVAG_026330 [Trichomonas vaginalis G3]|uniref:TfoX C-terminal domain-containing protein n=1 Tax=Trichomonas vaginalis (strain ATCC PRA-98 / G3) TaxID=412133 RepID=A2DZ36_TRIV3|nr:TfoX C-terminal domain-containing protein [Trichomonas vaginalis G3]EAY14312.1 hypothetical protein TVAG_026330 [Trichomonas vaginalis G3]KAI5517339.1 TfoX C-terminal domain-containing protein [Trichomonas vaginalis G3]|eukprot:XP_001326535.1 hypothetical protein [Trichomonas vaginalis G3]
MSEEEAELKLMPNIGETIAKKLNEVGVKTSTDLKKLGSKKAFELIRNKTVM